MSSALLLGLVGLLVLPAAPAFAGRILVTGHDPDLHCADQSAQCHFVAVAVQYVRGGAPDPSKPVLVLDRADLDLVRALDAAFGSGAVPRVVIDPRSPQFASAEISTSRYSAVLIASDITCGGCDLNEATSTPDSDAINARAGDIERFVNQGGGVYANSGGAHGDGDPSTGTDNYYSFIPIPVGGAPVSPPFTLTNAGRSLGFTDGSGGTSDDINCCETHNSFTNPASGSALTIAEFDSAGRAETLFAEGTISGGGIQPTPGPTPTQGPGPPVLFESVNVQIVSGTVLVATAPGRDFVPLQEARQIPVGSLVDTRSGQVWLVSAADSQGAIQSGVFSRGLFQVRQSPGGGGLTEARLRGGRFRNCQVRGSSGQARAAGRRRLSKRTVRRLTSNATGRFRTRGRHSAATVRGTVWTTTDRCDGTLTKVRRGSVRVRDFRRGKTVTVRAGRRYLARARR